MREEEEEEGNDPEVEDVVDPRVKGELDALNQSTTDINDLETKLSEERSKFKSLLSNASRQLEELGKKYGKSVDRARPYYETLKEAKQAQSALHSAVHNYQKSNGIYRAAKETISLAEEGLKKFAEHKVDSAWQEMMNLHTIRLMAAESDRTKSEALHAQATKRYEFLSKKAEKIRQKHKRSTATTKRYFDTKESLEAQLQKQRQCVETLQGQVDAAKGRYKDALSNLEKISTEIHQKRQLDTYLRKLLEPRDDVVDGGSDDDDISLANEFDLVGPKSYDNVGDLEEDLRDFNFEHDGSEDGSYSGSEYESDSNSITSSSTSSSGRRHSSHRRHFRRQISNASLDEEPTANQKRAGKTSMLTPTIQENVGPEENDHVFKQDRSDQVESPTNQHPGKLTRSSRDKTYDNLHGISEEHVTMSSTNQERSSDEYDIFDDLC